MNIRRFKKHPIHSAMPVGRGEQGSALIIVLILLMSLSAVAFLISTSQRYGNAVLQASQFMKQAQWYSSGAEILGKSILQMDRSANPERDHLQSRWAVAAVSFPLEEGVLTAQMRDATGCFNLNGMVRGRADNLVADEENVEEFDHLLEALSFEPPLRAALSATLVDWLDSNSIPERGGAEDFEYAAQSAGFRTANGLIADVSELRSMFWYTPAIFEALRPYICTYPEPNLVPINVNMITVRNLPVLYAALRGAVTQEALQKNLAMRPETGFQSIDQFWAVFPEDQREPLRNIAQNRVAVLTRYIHLDVTVRHDTVTLRSNMLLKMDDDGAVSTVSRKFGG